MNFFQQKKFVRSVLKETSSSSSRSSQCHRRICLKIGFILSSALKTLWDRAFNVERRDMGVELTIYYTVLFFIFLKANHFLI